MRALILALAAVFAVTAVLASCKESASPTAVHFGRATKDDATDDGDLASIDFASAIACQASPAQCSQVQQAIDYLLHRPDGGCQGYGKALQGRFNAPPGSGMGIKER